MKIKLTNLIKSHLIRDKFIHSCMPKIITIYIKIENRGNDEIPVLPKNKHKRIKGMPAILINVLDFLVFSLISTII